jgi:hypothetical protein
MRSSLGSRGLYATATITACLGLVVVSAIGVQKTYGAPNKAATLPPLPICAFNFSSQHAPSARETVTYTLSFAICKTVWLKVELVRPAAVTKVVAQKPKPTRLVHGNPVWVKRLEWRSYPTWTLRLTFANGLQTGQKVEQKFIFSAPGYRPDVEVVTQTVYNP